MLISTLQMPVPLSFLSCRRSNNIEQIEGRLYYGVETSRVLEGGNYERVNGAGDNKNVHQLLLRSNRRNTKNL